MRVSIETAEGLTRKITIAVPSRTFEDEFAERVRKTASQVKLPGFRPGRVPISEVRRRFGTQLRQEVASELLETSLSKAVREQELAMASRANVEIVTLEAGTDFEFTATFEVLPEFELVDLGTLRVRQPVAEVGDADVDAMVQTLREQRVSWHTADRPARETDRVLIDYTLKVDGAVVNEGEGKLLIVGTDGVLPELDAAVRGMSVDETRAFPATLPAQSAATTHDHHDHDHHDHHDHDHHDHDHDHHDHDHDHDHHADAGDSDADLDPRSSELGGSDSVDPTTRPAIGEVTVRGIDESSLPDLDDDFYDQLGIVAAEDEDRAAKFREDVRDRMAVELGNALRDAQRREVLTVLARRHDFELPQAMVDAEVAEEKVRLARMLDNVPDELPPLFVDLAKQRVRVNLAVNKIVTSEAIEPDDQRIQDRIDEIVSAYEQSAQVRNAIYADEQQLGAIEASVLQEQVVDHVLAQAEVEQVSTTYQDVMNGRALPDVPEQIPADDSPLPSPFEAPLEAAEGTGAAGDDDVQPGGETAEASRTDQTPETGESGFGGRLRRIFGARKDTGS